MCREIYHPYPSGGVARYPLSKGKGNYVTYGDINGKGDHMNYIIFEDEGYKNFLPFTYTRFVGAMRVGILKLRQRIGIYFDFPPANVILRFDLESMYRQRHKNWQINHVAAHEYTFINARVKLSETLKHEIEKLSFGQKLVSGAMVIAFKIKNDKDMHCTTETLHILYDDLKPITTKIKDPLWTYTWEFIIENGNMLKEDYQLVFVEEDNFIQIDPGVTAINPYNIWIGEGAELKHGVILDATDGPIVIDEKATIMHNAVIIGPAYIGKNSLVKVGSKIYHNTSIGPQCKVAGEIEGTIIQAYTNKQHDGYLGHSYIGEWVNIGADTNNSDLKNTYRPIKVWFFPQKEKVSTGNIFIGCFIGDHSKVGINCSINTGAVIGFGVNVYGKDLIADFIPSFSWGEAHSLLRYHLERFLETTENVKIRRKEQLISHEIDLIKLIYQNIDTIEG